MTSFDLMVDPETIGTPQHKQHSFVRGRLITYPDPRVAGARKVMAILARNARSRLNLEFPPHGTPVRLAITMFYAIPKCRRKDHVKNGVLIPRLRGGEPCTSHQAGDVDNKAKGIMDALTDAGLWADDKDVTDLRTRKLWTEALPRIRIHVSVDTAIEPDLTADEIREEEREKALTAGASTRDSETTTADADR